MDKKKITELLYNIINNADWILGSWRAWSDEEHFVSLIKKDAREIYNLIKD